MDLLVLLESGCHGHAGHSVPHDPVCAAFHDRLHSLVGPGGMFVAFIHGLFHIIGVLSLSSSLHLVLSTDGKSTWAQSSMPCL